MSRYVVWDKKTDIYTRGKDENGKMHWTAAEYINDHAQWAGNPAIKVVVSGGPINGDFFEALDQMVEVYSRAGLEFSAGMSDRQILDAIEEFEQNPPEAPPSAEERIAAALEFNNLLNM